MKKPKFAFCLAVVVAMVAFNACQKDIQEIDSHQAHASKYTKLTLNDNFDLPNPAVSEQYAFETF
jgi:hypothetical protein